MKDISKANSYNQFDKYLSLDFNKLDYLSKAQYIEVTTFLSNYLLSSQGDRVAMANSIEIRFPFLDHRLIEFMGRVPSKWKILGMNEKFLLKKLFRSTLPERIVNRSKHPYRAPIKHSLLNEKNNEIFNTYCSAENLKKTGIFSNVKTQKLFNKIHKFENPNEWDSMALTGIFSTQVIYDKFVKNFNPEINTNFNLDILIDKRTSKYD
jgi:asparagine synthase (glutamine-hydrolysing)